MDTTTARRAVFLSYASEDAAAAGHLGEGLEGAGIEVWLDRSELKGGDDWDARIRQQIRSCTLFIPIISATARARGEGYFRLEWKLAIDRSHLMASDQPFLVPVAIDGTSEGDARVPDRFRDMQWTRLPGGAPTAAFVEHVAKLLTGASAAMPAERDSERGATPRTLAGGRSRTARWSWVAAAVLAILLGILLIRDRFMASGDLRLAGVPEKSIAVLPLANSTGDPANEYISDGVSEELIASLSHLSQLKVIGRTSSFQFKGKAEGSRAIGEQLGVSYLLEGSVQKAADRVRIAVALVSAADGASIWAETFESEIKDIFTLQTRIASAVAGKLQVALLGTEVAAAQASADAGARENFAAYQAVLQGNFYYQRSTAEDMRKAVDYYSEAVRLDPTYASAWAKMSITVTHLVGNYTSTATPEGKETLARGRRAATTALSLDPLLGDAHRARALLLSHHDFDFVGAEAEFRRAVELEPQSSGSTAGLANLKAVFGRLDEAVALTRRALTLDPLNSGFHLNLANLLASLGRYDEAEATLRQAIELQPQAAQHYQCLAVIAILRGRSADAIRLAKQETDPFWQTFALALAYQAHGDRAQADAALKKLIDEDADDAGSQIASVYALRKEPEKMFHWLERALETHDVGVTSLRVDPFLRTYSQDPRFTAFARKLGAI
jgi:TolB-like protein/Tfp pilus assembly protein PilF